MARVLEKSLSAIAADLEKNRRTWLGLFGIFYFVSAALHAFRPLWYDELFSYNIARLGSVKAIWTALMHGADLNPPLMYLAMAAVHGVLGSGEFASRVPSMLGFLTLCYCLYIFVSRRAGPCYGFVALALPMITGAFAYATEARAYGMVLGFCGLALVSWQSASESKRRALPLGCLFFALTGALLSHCYAVLLLAPFALAELVRDYRRRRVDWPMWFCLLAPLGVCFTYLPLLSSVHPYAMDNPVFRPTWRSPVDFYEMLLTPALWPLLTGLALIAVFSARRRDQPPSENDPQRAEEIAAGAGFLLVPVLAILLAAFFTRVFMLRYGLAAVVGVSILYPLFAARLTLRSQSAAAGLAILICLWSAVGHADEIGRAFAAPSVGRISFEQRPELPLVISSGLIYYPMNHYASRQVVERTWYLIDPAKARRITGTDVFDRDFPNQNRFFPLRAKIEDYTTFLAAHHHFLVYGYISFDTDWLVRQLMSDGAQLRLIQYQMEQFGRAALYEVHMPGAGE